MWWWDGGRGGGVEEDGREERVGGKDGRVCKRVDYDK